MCVWLCCAATVGAASPVVRWRNQRLSVESAGAPVVKILAEVARETGLRVEGADSQRQPADVHFANLSLGEALTQLLVNVNFALVERSCGRNSPCFTLIVLGEHSPEMVADHHDGSAQSMTRTESSSDAAEHLQQVYKAAQDGDLELLQQAASVDDADATRTVALDLLAQKDPGTAASLALTAAGSSDLGQRVMGLQALAQVPSPAALKELRDALDDSDEGVRETALTALAQQPSAGAVHLLRRAAEDPDPSIQTLAKNLLQTRRAAGGSLSGDASSD